MSDTAVTYAATSLPGWFTCQLCSYTYNPGLGSEHPHCQTKLFRTHWLVRFLVGAIFGR